mmetsp:Transcript_29257/g.55270  ORF Transcript_29257/g.55270 Transcript_29257/m.55270 type:complete len:104 (-) Transcript_29257:984-1295(-)
MNATDQQSPAFTAGGSSEADIATPTRLDVLFPKVLSATPMPLGIAITIPVTRPATSPREDISLVGHVSVRSPPSTQITPKMTPSKQQSVKATISVHIPFLTNL